MDYSNDQQSFWQFSDQLRLHTSNLANLSLNDSIWSNNYPNKRPDQRRNFDIKVGGEINSGFKPKGSDFAFNDGWNIGNTAIPSGKSVAINGGFNKGLYSSQPAYVNLDNQHYFNINLTSDEKIVKKNNNSSRKQHGGENNNDNKSGAIDKKSKTLPASESLPRNETIGGYIFVCNNDTMAENLRRQLFGMSVYP